MDLIGQKGKQHPNALDSNAYEAYLTAMSSSNPNQLSKEDAISESSDDKVSSNSVSNMNSPEVEMVSANYPAFNVRVSPGVNMRTSLLQDLNIDPSMLKNFNFLQVIMENFIDQNKDSLNEINMKRNLAVALVKSDKNRNYKDLADLKKFFTQYEYFKKLQSEHGDKAYEEIMKIIKITGVPAGTFVIEEGEVGDKFFMILQGQMEVFKMQERKMKEPEPNQNKVIQYLDYLYSHYNQIHWQMVPYAKNILTFFKKVKHYKDSLRDRIITDIYRLLGENLLTKFQLINRKDVIKDRNYLIRKSSLNIRWLEMESENANSVSGPVSRMQTLRERLSASNT